MGNECLSLSGVFSCSCGHDGNETAFISRYHSNSMTNWIECPQCHATVRLTKNDADEGIPMDELKNNQSYWDWLFKTKKAKIGPMNPWLVKDYIELSIEPTLRVSIRGTAKAHKHKQTLREILSVLSTERRKVVLVALSNSHKLKPMEAWAKYKDTPMTWLSWAISFGKYWAEKDHVRMAKQYYQNKRGKTLKERVTNCVNSKQLLDSISKVRYTESNPAIEQVDWAINHYRDDVDWIKNGKHKTPKWYSYAKLDNWMNRHDLSMSKGETPEPKDYDPWVLDAQCHDKQRGLRPDEIGSFDEEDEDVDELDIALRDIAYDEWKPLNSKTYKGFEEKLRSEYDIGFDDTDTNPSCEVPEEVPYNLDMNGLKQWANQYKIA